MLDNIGKFFSCFSRFPPVQGQESRLDFHHSQVRSLILFEEERRGRSAGSFLKQRLAIDIEPTPCLPPLTLLPRCYRHQTKSYREINKFNTSARIIGQKQARHQNNATPHGASEENASHMGLDEKKRVEQLLYKAIRIMSVSELPRAGGPVRVELCRDCRDLPK